MKNSYLFKTDVGWIAVIFNEKKIVGVQFAGKNEVSARVDIEQKWQAETSLRPPKWIKDLSKKIKLHLSGETQSFAKAPLELSGMTPFRKKVYENAMKIKSGQVMTYGQLAAKSGSPGAARAVGSAMARNP